jgi:hypothetical protein
MKSAALTLQKESLGSKKKGAYAINARLTFKYSNDLRGVSETIKGDNITVCFSLAIKRASFQLWFSSDRPNVNPAKFLQLAKIAHHSSIATMLDITNYVQARTTLSISGKLEGSTNHKVGVGGKTATSRKSSAKSKIRVPSVNIAVTVSPTMIHWEMEPVKQHFADNSKSHLEGDVFVESDGNSGRPVPACEIKWDSEKANSALVIRGSVFVSMEDLEVEKIRFTDDLGQAVSLNRLAQPDSSGWSQAAAFNPFPTSSAKQRFVKQIIRKHLVSQGMEIQGAYVEVCSAYT